MRTRHLLLSTTTAIAAFSLWSLSGPGTLQAADNAPLLRGHVTSLDGAPLAGIPVKAHLAGSNITVSVYSDKNGDYDFPVWSDVKPGAWTVKVEMPDFAQAAKDGVTLANGKTARVNLTLKSKPVDYNDATASEIIAGLPGTDQQKVLFSQCSNCHTLQWALQAGRTKEDWIRVI